MLRFFGSFVLPIALSMLFVALAAIVDSPAKADQSTPYSIAPALQSFVNDRTVPGMITLIASKDKILSAQAIGYADVAAKKPMDVNDLCWIASMNKSMTCACLMMLVDEGKVNLDDPVDKYLPFFKPEWVIAEQDKDHQLLKHPQNPILVRYLLDHTSGLPYSTGVEQPSLDMVPLASRVYDYASTPLLFEPGTKDSYSNAGINTAARIIEIVSGMPYETFIKQRLFEPLGMKDATFRLTPAQLARVPVTYAANKGDSDWAPMQIEKLHYPLDDPARQPVPGNGLFATAHDAACFCQMLLNKGVGPNGQRILSESAVDMMTTKQTPDVVKNRYGFGLEIYADGYGHGGSDRTFMRVNPSRGIISVLMVQMYTVDGPRFEKFSEAFRREVNAIPAQN